jgi:hypothetical protein
MDFLNHFLSLSLSFTFWSRIIHTRKRAKKKGRRRRGGDKKITERKNLSLAHTASSSSLKNYIRICLNSRPLSPSLYLLLLVYYNDSSSSFPNKHNRVHTTSATKGGCDRVRREKKKDGPRRSRVQGEIGRASGEVRCTSRRRVRRRFPNFFFLRVDDAHGQLTFFCRERRFCASRFEGTGRRAKRTRGGDATNRARDDGLRTRAELF